MSRCAAPRCRKPTHEPPICARSVPKAALARPLPTRQTRKKGRLNFLYPQQLYGKIRAAFGDTEYGYVAELEESEDRLLEAFDEAARDADTPPAARDVIVRLLPEVRASHDVMRARKHAMKNNH
ncbi:hypothetical protein CO641_14990 [Lysobacteraceae bacterium NML91-0213]|nr:hypothetical protein CO641_14990 [Xanthomonadaceae bacterium NML91-0213]